MKSVRLYEEEIKTLVGLPEKSRGKILSAILCDCVGEALPELTAMEKAVFTLINGQVKRAEELSQKKQKNSNARWNSNANDMQTESKDDANVMQTESKTDANLSTNTNTNTNTKTETNTNTNTPSSARGSGFDKKRYAEFVWLLESEYAALVEKLGEERTKRAIEILDNYKGSSGKTYESDYRAILAWVVKRLDENPPPKPANTRPQSHSSSFDMDAIMDQIMAKYD